MLKQIHSAPDLCVRLHKTGRFSLRWCFTERDGEDGATFHACREATGKTAREVFAGLYCASPERLPEMRAALQLCEAHHAEAFALQRQHSAKLRAARQAAKAQHREADLDAMLDALSESEGGAA